MMKCKLSLIVVVLFTILISGCSKENPQAVIIVRDTEDRLVKNAKVEIYSKPGNSILEDSDFTDEHGKSYHEFTFEGTFIVEVDVENFDQAVIEESSKRLVILDISAEWCGPCKMIAPVLEEIADEQVGSLKIAKVNVDDAPDLAQRFEVMSIPTLILFKDGQPVKRIVGAKGKPALLAELSEFI